MRGARASKGFGEEDLFGGGGGVFGGFRRLSVVFEGKRKPPREKGTGERGASDGEEEASDGKSASAVRGKRKPPTAVLSVAEGVGPPRADRASRAGSPGPRAADRGPRGSGAAEDPGRTPSGPPGAATEGREGRRGRERPHGLRRPAL